MNKLIQTAGIALLFVSGVAIADVGGAFHTDVHEGISESIAETGGNYGRSADPIAAAFPGNPELYAGHEADGSGSSVASNLSSLDMVNAGSPESEICGCS
ncbi:hypothetical protein [Solemya velum gill symbiont]|uniref:hypothetical protein n=1 Tax=Solemya velum gill symbiont TaxID=2340 RepID=UPI000997AC21|nr:hypothetical protein [Solemya velum gill symbiont]OOY83250.1 hypothetical protein BOW12_02055 [Solemya velum gill symbiont]